jgi:hypothetical protein
MPNIRTATAFLSVNIRPIGFLLLGPALVIFLQISGTGEEGSWPYLPLAFWAPLSAYVAYDLVFFPYGLQKSAKETPIEFTRLPAA